MIKKLFLLVYFAALTTSISANTNTSELDKFNSAKSSVSFTENKGQISDQNYNPRPDVLFSGEANGLTFHIRKDGISYQTSRVDSWKQQDENLPEGIREEGKTDSVPDQMTIYRTDINWLGFNKDYTIENGESTAGFNNYYLPSCPDGAMNVRSYSGVTFKNLYTGVDVKWYEKNGELEYDFIVAPNTDYTKISWEIKGTDRISIGENGQLIIETPLGNIEEQAPIAFQGETIVEAAWKIDGNKISFQLGDFNTNETLIIDPVVRLWGTYYGGSGNENGSSIATDTVGNVYLAGSTSSPNGIATTGSHQTIGVPYPYNDDAFLVKFNSNGVRQWGTYYGGTGAEGGISSTIDASGNVYLAGRTESTAGIASVGAHQATYGGGRNDGFLVKFNSSGVRQWGTYYGGKGGGYSQSCATDTSGNIYLSGCAQSTTGIATTGSHQTAYGGGATDVYLVKFNSSGVRQWGTYYGGTSGEYAFCAADATGNVYLGGITRSTTGISSTGAHQTTFGGGSRGGADAFLVKFNSSGVRQWGTYYGGTSDDAASSCEIDASGNVYLSGQTQSNTGINTIGAHQTSIGGSNDAFLVKFNSNGVRQWGTYYGGTVYDVGNSCTIDTSGNVYLAGSTQATSGIAAAGAHQITYAGGPDDAYLVKFNSSGVRQWGTYYGGTGRDYGIRCAADASGNVYLAGNASSTSGIATTVAHQNLHGGKRDAFLVKFNSTSCDPMFSIDSIVTCNSLKWINRVTYTASNTTAKDTLVNAAGCDSVVTLNLTINYSTTATDVYTACDSYTWIDGVTYTASNTTAKDTLVNAAGCDSVVTLNLTINYSTTATDVYTACDSYTWIDGVTYTASNTTAKDTLAASNGCDSIVTLNLTINYTKTFTDSIVACDSYTWIDGVTYTASNTTAKDTLAASNGCDSIVTLNLTINYTKTFTDSIVACDAYTWIDGVTYTSNDTSAIYTLVTSKGCDSIVSLNLIINIIDKGIFSSDDTLTTLEYGAQYRWLNCLFNFGVIGGDTDQVFVAKTNGSYAAEITKKGCIDTTDCYIVSTVGIDNPITLSNVKVYPNPTNGKLTIDAENYEGVEVYNVSGRLIIKSKLNTIDLEEQSKGLYLLKINANGTTQEFKVFKQ